MPPPQPTHPHTYFSLHLFSARQPIKREPRDVNQRRRNAMDITIYSCFPLTSPCLCLVFSSCLSIHPFFGRGVGEESWRVWGFEIVLARASRTRLLFPSGPLTEPPPSRPPASFHPSIQIIHRLPQPNVPYHLSTYIYMNVYPYIRTYS